jgi:hypothetical protein
MLAYVWGNVCENAANAVRAGYAAVWMHDKGCSVYCVHAGDSTALDTVWTHGEVRTVLPVRYCTTAG